MNQRGDLHPAFHTSNGESPRDYITLRSLSRCFVIRVPTSTKAAAAVTADARGLGFLSLFLGSSAQTIVSLHLSQNGSGLLSGIAHRWPPMAGVKGPHVSAECCRIASTSRKMGGGSISRVPYIFAGALRDWHQHPEQEDREQRSRVSVDDGGSEVKHVCRGLRCKS